MARRIGGYELIRPLGAGGMGEVLLARDPDLDRLVAVKMLRRDIAVDPAAQQRFRREAKALASLKHPGIVTIHEIDQDDGRDFMVMEFLSGANLRAHLRAHERSQTEILALATQIADALVGAHSAGVLHRDIKPENIMVIGDGTIKIVDFGLARSLDEIPGRQPNAHIAPDAATVAAVVDVMGVTLEVGPDSEAPDTRAVDLGHREVGHGRLAAVTAVTETILGTPGYMAPELFFGQPPTAASDVYSLGVVFYEMLAGQLPFASNTLEELLRNRVYGDAEPPRLDECDRASTEVADLVADMLAKDPDRRPAMQSIGARLERACSADARAVRPALPQERRELLELSREIDVRPARRRRRLVRLAGAAAVAATALAGALWLSRPATGNEAVAPAPSQSLASKSVRVAVPPIDVTLRSYAHGNGTVANSAATVLASVLNRADALVAIPPGQLRGIVGTGSRSEDEWQRAARELGAMYGIRGTLEENRGSLTGRFELTHLLTREVDIVTLAPRPVAELDGMLIEAAHAIVERVAPGSVLVEPQHATKRSIDSLALYEQALADLYAERWVDACLKLERIVKEQPAFFEAWYHLTIASAWAAQPVESSLEAARTALSLATSERDRELIRVLILYLEGRFSEASPHIAKLAERFERDAEIAYLHAEVVYHDGRYARGLELFDEALRISPRQQLATVHPLQHAEANGNLDTWKHFRSLRKVDKLGSVDRSAKIRFAMRDYQGLAEEPGIWRMRALSVLQRDREADAELPHDRDLAGSRLLYAMARAVEQGRTERARQLFERAWSRLAANADVVGSQFGLGEFAEVLIAGDMDQELRTFLTYWDLPGARSVRSQQAIVRSFAAIPLGDASLVRTNGHASWREARQAEALLHELAGDYQKAAAIWQLLLDDPSQGGDHLERLALARALRAVGRTDEARAVCAELIQPKVWRPAYPLFRKQCRGDGPNF